MRKITNLLIVSFLFALVSSAQVPNLGSLSTFALYSTAGAVGNTGISVVSGDIGSNIGAITGFGAPSVVNGTIHNADLQTAQCAKDLDTLYGNLSKATTTNSVHVPAFGGGETLFAGVYAIGGAASVAGELILDAQNNSDAIFIFKINGAFTSAASSTVTLLNGTKACNVFWVAEGAIALAATTTMRGTLLAHPGAVSMGANCNLEGRMFSTTGAISTYGNILTVPECNPVVVAIAPNLSPTIAFYSAVVSGITDVAVIFRMKEYNGSPTNGLITVKISKDANYILAFDPTLTTLAGKAVHNSGWSFDNTSDPAYYVLKTTNVIAAKGKMSLGFTSTIYPNGTIVIASINGLIVNGSGGDNTDNDNGANATLFYKP